MANGYRTLSQHLNDLKKENFSLKLRIYFLEERVQQKGEGSRDDVYRRVSTHGGQVPGEGGVSLPMSPTLQQGAGAGGAQLVGMPGRALGMAPRLGEPLHRSSPLAAFDGSGERDGEGVPSPVGWVAVPVWARAGGAGTPHPSAGGLKYHPCHPRNSQSPAAGWGTPHSVFRTFPQAAALGGPGRCGCILSTSLLPHRTSS